MIIQFFNTHLRHYIFCFLFHSFQLCAVFARDLFFSPSRRLYEPEAGLSGLGDKGEKGILRQLSYAKLLHKTDREYQVWQEGRHPVLIQGAVRRGYVDDPVH